MVGVLPALIFRWTVGGLVAILTGAGIIMSVIFQVRSGWDRSAVLGGVGCSWVFIGALAFAMHHDFGRQILLGTTEAFALFFGTVAAIAWLSPTYFMGPPALQWAALTIVVVAALMWMGLRSVASAPNVEEDRGGRRTSG